MVQSMVFKYPENTSQIIISLKISFTVSFWKLEMFDSKDIYYTIKLIKV